MKSYSKKETLLMNSLILFLGKFSTQFLSFLLLPLYTAFFSTEDYGIVDLLTTYIVLLVPVISIQIEMYLFRYLIDNRNNEKEKKNIVSNALFLVLLLAVATIIAFLLVCTFVNVKYYNYLIWVVAATILANMAMQISRGLGKNIDYSLCCLLVGVINVTLNFIFIMMFKMGVESVFIATIISNLSGAVFIFFRHKVYRYISFKCINKNNITEIIKYSMPLVPNGIVWWVVDTSDRTIISLILGLGANGIYSVSNKFSHIINSFYSIFNMSWTEALSLYFNDDEDNFLETTFNSIFKLICSLCLLLLNSMFILFAMFVNKKYSAAYAYAYILIIAAIFSMLASNLSAVYIAAKKTKKLAITTIISAICNLIVHLSLINFIGLYAASISTLISFFILFLVRYIDVQKIAKIRIDKSVSILFIVLFLLSYFPYSLEYLLLKIVWLISIIVTVLYINRDFGKKIVLKVKMKIYERKN